MNTGHKELTCQSCHKPARGTIRQQLQADEFDLDKLIDEIESRSIRIALEMNDNNVSKAAKALKINRTTLYSRVQKLGTD